jgi:hypothetical protein
VAKLDTTAFSKIIHSIKHKATTEDNYFYARKNLSQDDIKNMRKLFEDGIPTVWFSIIKPKI